MGSGALDFAGLECTFHRYYLGCYLDQLPGVFDRLFRGGQGYSDALTVSIDGCKPWNFSIDCPVFLLSINATRPACY